MTARLNQSQKDENALLTNLQEAESTIEQKNIIISEEADLKVQALADLSRNKEQLETLEQVIATLKTKLIKQETEPKSDNSLLEEKYSSLSTLNSRHNEDLKQAKD